MAAQSWPAGQHSAAVIVDVVLSSRHCVLLEQQKSEGKLLPHGLRFAIPPHVDSCRLAKGVKFSGIQKAASRCSSSGIKRAFEQRICRKQTAIRDAENMMKVRAPEEMRGYLKGKSKVRKDQAAQRPREEMNVY